MILAAALPAAGQDGTAPAVKVRLYDHNYGDFGGEFAADGSLLRCPYNTDTWVAGMVADTLAVDTAKGKKIPRSGAANISCPVSLEKWFDPAEARLSTCGELPLRNVGTSARPVWSFESGTFFPMDGLSVEPDRKAVPFHDFSFCMEINAGFIQRGGEVLKFRGDDDLWVYLDGRLVVDRGGIHFAKGDTVEVDALASSAGKSGSYRDLDIYFCSRLPATSVFAMEVPLDARPHPLRALRITDTAGRELVARDVVVGRTRVCAGPIWEAGEAAACGNYRPPPAGFVSADWDLNGEPRSGPGGSPCVDLDPSGYPHGTKVQLTARSGGKLARIGLTLARPAKVKEGRLRGRGRAEWVEVPVDTLSGAAPEILDVEFRFAGRDRLARAYPDGGPSLYLGWLGTSQTGPTGLTGTAPLDALARQTHFGRAVEQPILLVDGMGPVLTGARVRWSETGAAADGSQVSGHPKAWLEWETSEDLARNLALSDLAGKRAGRASQGLAAFGIADRPAASGPGPLIESTSPGLSRFRLPLTEAEALAFQEGDSLTLRATAADIPGNPAPEPFHVPILPPGRARGILGVLRFADNPSRGAPFVPEAGLPRLILADRHGNPIGNRDEDRKVARAGGPLLLIPSDAPLSRIELDFHDNLGGSLGGARLDISPEDWEALRSAASDTTWVGLRWYPVSQSAYRLGTGVYIVQGKAWNRSGALYRGSNGAWVRTGPGLTPLGPIRFGFIRE